jgi:uncharacterized membrane protein
MDTGGLEFQGVSSRALLMWLLLGVAALLVGYGVWQLLRRRVRDGLVCVSAVVPPATAAVLLVDAAVRRQRGDAPGARSSLLGGLLVAGGTAAVLAWAYAAGGRLAPAPGHWPMGAWMALLALEVAVAVGVFYAAVYAYLGTRRMAILMVLRCAAILALLLILFKPALSFLPETRKAYLPILLDRSASMDTVDEGSPASRYVQALHMLGTQTERIERYFRPAWFHFARRARSVGSWEELSELKPTGEGTDATDIVAALRAGANVADRPNLAGLLLISDGVHNAASDLAAGAADAGAPVYALGVGAADEAHTGRRNFRLLAAEAPFEVIKDNVSTLTVRVRCRGFRNVAGKVHLLDADGNRPLAEADIWTGQLADEVTEKIRWTPRGRPTTDGAEDDDDAPAARSTVRRLRVHLPPNAAETVTADNTLQLHVLVTEPRIRVLYVEGTIRPEYKFLRRALSIDHNVQLVTLVRTQQNKFWSAGQIEGRRLLQLPRAQEDFDLFDVIILGDLDRTFLTREQMAGFRRFVRAGGGLLMIGGHNSFGPGGYADTDIEAVLPVFVGNRSQPQETTRFLPMLTTFGRTHPIFDGIRQYFPAPGHVTPAEKDIELPPLKGCTTLVRPRQGATVLAVHPTRKNEHGPLIVLAVQPVEAGRSAAFAADTTWQWYLPLEGMGAQSPYRLFWGQMVRWLADVQGKPKQANASLVGRLSPGYLQVGSSVKLLARVKDTTGQPTDAARVSAEIVPVDAEPPGPAARAPEEVSVPLAARKSDGMYETNYRAEAPGRYRVRLTALDAEGRTLGSDELALHVAPKLAETEQLARDGKALERIAGGTGGTYRDLAMLPEALDEVIDHLRATGGLVPAPESVRLYNFPLLFVLFVVLLTGEWLLRRNWQLQ